MLYNIYDIVVGRMLEVCGAWLGHEGLLHGILLPTHGRILEAGAHTGAMTIPLASRVAHGRLLALEPSRLNLQLLTANLALAQLPNVDTHQAALGAVSEGTVVVEEPDVMPFADFRRLSTGKRHRKVPVVSVDQVLGPSVDRLDLLRLGLGSIGEGQQLSAAVQGAKRSLERFKPWVLLELPLKRNPDVFDMEVRGEEEAALLDTLAGSGYECVRCDRPLGTMPSELTRSEASQRWGGCMSDPRAQLTAKMLLCGHRSRTTGSSADPDPKVWIRAVSTCGPSALKIGRVSEGVFLGCLGFLLSDVDVVQGRPTLSSLLPGSVSPGLVTR